jgi:hypothetical protein
MSTQELYKTIFTLHAAGISREDAAALRRISLALRAWFTHGCNGTIQRDDTTGKPYAYYEGRNGAVYRGNRVPDRETGAMRRLEIIMRRYPNLSYYVQGDPRGAALYILRPGDIPEGAQIYSHYPNGISVF